MIIENVDFDLPKLVDGTAERLDARSRQKHVSITTLIDHKIPHIIQGDPGLLRHILLNLAAAAVKFSERGDVLIQANLAHMTEQGLRVRFSVTYQGSGLTAEQCAQLLSPRLESTATAIHKCSDNRLSTCSRLVKLLGGEFDIDSVKDHGTSYWFALPFRKSLANSAKRTLGSEHRSVIVVDHDPVSRGILNLYLDAWGADVTCVTGGSSAIDALKIAFKRQHHYDLAILAVEMPDMSGVNLWNAVKSDPDLAQPTACLFLSADEMPEQSEQLLAQGVNGHLRKPIRQSLLFNCLADLFGAQDCQGASIIQGDAAHEETGTQKAGGLVLLVEDHPANRIVGENQLSALGFSVHTANDGLAALDAVSKTSYDVILMDCDMPVMDGLEAARKIREQESTTGSHVPIIAFTANSGEWGSEACAAAGMDDYLSKPSAIEDLLRKLERWLPRKK